MVEIICGVVSLIAMLGGLVFEFIYVLRTGKLASGIFYGWVFLIFGTFVASVILPVTLSVLNPDYVKYFPEPMAVGFAIFLGGLYALIIAALSLFVRFIKERLRHSKPKINEELEQPKKA